MGVLVLSCIMVCLLLFIAIVSLVAHYTAAKYVIAQNQTESQLFIYNRTNHVQELASDKILDTTEKDAAERTSISGVIDVQSKTNDSERNVKQTSVTKFTKIIDTTSSSVERKSASNRNSSDTDKGVRKKSNISNQIYVNKTDFQNKTNKSERNVIQTNVTDSTTISNVFKLFTTSTPLKELMSAVGDDFYLNFYNLHEDTDMLWTNRHLLQTVLPVHYKLHLDITVKTTSGRCRNFGSYTGNVTITINVRNDTEFIVIHADDFRLHTNQIMIKGINKQVANFIKGVRYNYVYEYYVIKMADILESGLYGIFITNFTGCITKYTGLFLSSYTTEEGETR